MSRETRKALEALLESKITAAQKRALADEPGQNLKPDMDEIAAYSRLVDLSQPRWSADSGMALAVAFICVSIAAFLWSTPVPQTTVSLAVESASMRGEFARNWEFSRLFQAKTMHFERLTTVEAPNLDLSLRDKQNDAWFKVEGGQIQLEALRVQKGGLWEAVTEGDQVSIFLSRAAIEGRVTVRGKISVTAGAKDGEKTLDKQFELAVPETIAFAVQDPKSVPAEMSVHAPQAWSMTDIPFASLGFSREQATESGETTLTSGIRSGTLQFADTSWSVIQLFENELVAVHDSKKARIDVRNQEGLMHVTLNGPVRNVTVGDETTRRNLVPSYLEYFYNRKSWGFFWGAIIFLWSALWSVRKTLLR